MSSAPSWLRPAGWLRRAGWLGPAGWLGRAGWLRSAAGWLGRLDWVLRPASAYAASRAVVLSAALLASATTPHLPLGRALTRWDSGWYVLTAVTGYPHHLPVSGGHVAASTIAFFPLFPLSIRALWLASGLPPAVAGLVLSEVFGLAAAVAVWALSRHLWGPAPADRACALFCFFPGAAVFSLVYSEGLMLVLAAACLWALARRRWVLAGVLAALATATRPNAIALAVACAWAALVAITRRREWRSLSAPLLAPAGILAYFAYLWVHTGRLRAWFLTESGGWHERVKLGATWTKVTAFAQHPFTDLNVTVVVAGLAFLVLAGLVLLTSKVPGALLVYAGVVVAMALVSRQLGLRPRFLLTAFPLVTVLGYRLRGVAYGAVLAGSGALLFFFTVVTVSTLRLTP
ncbi:MAG: mannosyltransferase family protein [Acidimicrobiales bacterium]